ncbi:MULTISPECIES: hypothetical protein [Bacillus cereus group]|uniref:hypothetical protein n=1 Tax=Bacillus cereus group TaxID=86661 RepID=UPI001F58D98B|nr:MULTISPECIES: hypothetical protein [Bacillus cereus group]MDH2888531.1 hypothetical protein [Bacillus cytotoxicus]
MKDTTKYVGLDVSKEKIAVAIADEVRGEPRYSAMIPHTPESLRKLIKKLGAVEHLKVCYEAGPTGYEIYRLLLSLGVDCAVIAPSLIPQKTGKHKSVCTRNTIVYFREEKRLLKRLLRSQEN